MEFEFDENKSASNFEKHGINFIEAQKIWNDQFKVVISARTTEENRSIVIGNINGSVWSAIYTLRSNAVRIISVRRARKNEKQIYYSTGI